MQLANHVVADMPLLLIQQLSELLMHLYLLCRIKAESFDYYYDYYIHTYIRIPYEAVLSFRPHRRDPTRSFLRM